MKFCGRSDLKEYVLPADQLVEWGGQLNYHFVFEPEFLPAAGPTHINGEDSRKKVNPISNFTNWNDLPINFIQTENDVEWN